MKMDAAAKRVLGALVNDPDADVAELAVAAEMSQEVAIERLQRLRRNGTFLGRSIRLDARSIGFPYEGLVLARPSAQTDRALLEQIARAPRVTRMFTLAADQSVAFTVIGRNASDLQRQADELGNLANLEAITLTMMVETLADDHASGLHRAWVNEAVVH